MPRTVTEEHFASIFNARAKSSKISETMSTLADTIDQLEAPMASVTISGQSDAQSDGMHKFEVRNADGSESSIHLQVDAMAGDFFPFRPPPLPQVQTLTDAQAAAAPEAHGEAAVGLLDESSQHQHRVYKAMFTIEESVEADGQTRIVAHSPRIMHDGQPRSFLERLAQRQLRFDEARARRESGGMLAISVKRQRKLKMKKKKYKKLMKRTRNLRRKLDRS
jgi:hypothetical protein